MRLIAAGLRLADAADVPDGGALVIEAEGVGVVLTRRGDAVYGFRNRCTHADYPLQRADGRVLVQERRFLVCGAHGASYDLETGACAGGPCNGRALTRIAVRVREGVVFSA